MVQVFFIVSVFVNTFCQRASNSINNCLIKVASSLMLFVCHNIHYTLHATKNCRSLRTQAVIWCTTASNINKCLFLMKNKASSFHPLKFTFNMTAFDLPQETTSSENSDSKFKGIIIKLNVGGTSFSTFHGTLAKSNYFANLLSTQSMTSKTLLNKEEIFIDRSGELFRDILFYLRTGFVTSSDKKKLLSLKKEAEFYQLKEMIEAVKCREQSITETNKSIPICICDVDILDPANDGTKKYVATKAANGKVFVYQVIGVIDVFFSSYCDYHQKHGCDNCSKQKLILRPCNKKLV